MICSKSETARGAGTPAALMRAAMLLLPLALAACTSSKPAEVGVGGAYKVGKPYQVAGIWYYPREDEHYDATGIASWYGPQFHGKPTANGERFDQEGISAAHPTLPMPVLARVTNLENGRSLVVRVNDRGPFVAGREIDLSRKAAELLGYDRKGTAKVRVQYVGRAPLPGIPGTSVAQAAAGQESYIAPKPATDETERRVASAPRSSIVTASALAAPAGVKSAEPVATSPIEPASGPLAMRPIADEAQAASQPAAAATDVQQVPVSAGTNLFVQAGSFRTFANAEAVHQRLLAEGVQNVRVTSTVVDGATYYRVRVGPLADVPAADASLQSVVGKGHAGARIVVD